MEHFLTESQNARIVEVLSCDPQVPVSERIRIRQDTRMPLAPKEVRIGMLAMNILPADLLQMNRQYGHQPSVPYVPGHEGVAVVLETGSEITDLHEGDRVLPIGVFGVWADELVVQRRSLIAVPSNSDVLQQAMLAANPATAWVLLKHQANIQPGQWVVQNAANSAVGQCTRQLAAHLNINLINVVRRPEAVASDESGHWLVDDGNDPDSLKAEVQKITRGETVVLGLDAIGGVASQACRQLESTRSIGDLRSSQRRSQQHLSARPGFSKHPSTWILAGQLVQRSRKQTKGKNHLSSLN